MSSSYDTGLGIRDLCNIRNIELQEGPSSLELARTYHALGMTPETSRRVWDAAISCLRARSAERN